MTTNTSVNVGLSGSTGTGSFVGSDNPTFTTAITFGASAYAKNLSGIQSSTGLNNLAFSYIPAAVNYITSQNASTGNYPLLIAQGSDSNIYLSLSGKGTSGVSIFGDTNLVSDITGHTIASFNTIASAVNYLKFENNATGFPPSITSLGSDTNISLALVSKGSGYISLTGYGGLTNLALFTSIASAVNYIVFQNNATGSAPAISALGGDANVTLQLNGKGTSGVAIVGVSTNSNAATGEVGEYRSSSILAGSAVALTSGVTANITSVPLTAGDWEISSTVAFAPNAATTSTSSNAGISTTSATLPTAGAENNLAAINTSFAAGQNAVLSVGVMRLKLAAPTTVYLVAASIFAVNTMSAYGFIGATRAR